MLITSESVKRGHPDALCDAITANIIAEILDEEAKLGLSVENMPHCGIEVFLGKNLCVVGGEVKTRVYVDIDKIVRKTIIDTGYNDIELGLDGKSIGIINAIIQQSPDIDCGTSYREGHCYVGAGDQGIIYGFACNETPEYLPLPYVLVNKMMWAFEDDSLFAPDGKGQITIDYKDINKEPYRITNVLMSNAIHRNKTFVMLKDQICRIAKKKVFTILNDYIDADTEFIFNGTGEWNADNSCSAADSGVTGRKLVVQLYGGYPGAQIGGGAVINKTPEKVDCSAVFATRYIAKNIVAAGLASKCSVQLAYAIGKAEPVAIRIDTFGTGKEEDRILENTVEYLFPITPRAMIEKFDLLKGNIYRHLARTLFMDQSYPWERTDMADLLIEAFNSYM